MWRRVRRGIRLARRLVIVGILTWASGTAGAQDRPGESNMDHQVLVDGQFAVHALMSLSDGHVQKVADVLEMMAQSAEASSGNWEEIREPMARAARITVPAVHWFALTDGTYWTLEGGKSAANLLDREYFHRALAGETIAGTLVVSHSTNRNTAIVAVPVRVGEDVVGVLGASIHLNSLSLLLREELGGLADNQVFFAIDSEPLGAVHSDSSLIFTEPMKLGDEDMRNAFSEILAGERGTVTYNFRGGRRLIHYLKSPVTGWWYGFGITGRPEAGS